MKKKFIALFAVCSMISTAAMGLVQTAYADADPISIVVSDGATDTEKVVTLYYGFGDVACIEGTLSVDNGATITSGSVTLQYASGMGDSTFNTNGYMFVSSYGDGLTSADKSFATATITVPGDVDVTVSFTPINLFDGNFDDYGTEVVTVTIPKKSSEPETPATVDASVEEAKAYVDKNDETNCAVVGKINLTVGGSINLADATYEGNKAQAITDMNDQDLADTTITNADIILFVVINGTTDVAELDKVVFE